MTKARQLADLISSGSIETGEITSLDASKLTGTIADARVPASAVTQHANNYVHPNHTGEVTSTADGATVISNTAITGQTEKTSLADADKFLISDSADSNALKYVQKSNLPSGGVTLLGSIESSSNSSTIAIDSVMDNSSYAYYIVEGLFNSGGNGAIIEARFRDGGSALTASLYNFSNLRWEAGSGSPQLSTGSSSNHADIVDGVGTRTFSFHGYIFPCLSIGNMGLSICDWSGKISAYASGSRNIRKVSGAFEFVNATVPDGFQIVNQTANFEDYEMRIYGVTR